MIVEANDLVNTIFLLTWVIFMFVYGAVKTGSLKKWLKRFY